MSALSQMVSSPLHTWRAAWLCSATVVWRRLSEKFYRTNLCFDVTVAVVRYVSLTDTNYRAVVSYATVLTFDGGKKKKKETKPNRNDSKSVGTAKTPPRVRPRRLSIDVTNRHAVDHTQTVARTFLSRTDVRRLSSTSK